jgi:hypothetical protein
MDVYAADKVIADIPLSMKQMAMLEAGEAITVIFHTPQMLRDLLGPRNGAFTLVKDNDRITTAEPDSVKQFADLQRAIHAVRRENG